MNELNQTCGDGLSWTARYFLRQLALARKNGRKSEAASYSKALSEVTFVAIVAPFVAAFSCIVITSLKWAPTFGRMHPDFSPKLTGLVVGFLVLGVGTAWFRRRFSKFRAMPAIWAAFDTEEDRRLVFWQKVIILTLCGAVVPLLALALTLWIL